MRIEPLGNQVRESVVSVTEIARNLSDYLNRVVYRGERFLLTRGGKPIADLRSVPQGRSLRDLPSLVASAPHLAPEDLDAFARDIESGRASAEAEPPRDPWGS